MKPAEDEFCSDEIKKEDGLERYWLFYNGQWAETISGLVAAICGVFWCFLYILGFGQTWPAYLLGILAIVGLICLRFLYYMVREHTEGGWAKKASPGKERRQVIVAVALWAFILLFFGGAILSNLARHH